MSTRSSVFYTSTNKWASIHIYHEGLTGNFHMEIEQDNTAGFANVNIQIQPELKDAFIAAAIAYPQDVKA